MKKRLFVVLICAVLIGVGLWFSKMRDSGLDISAQTQKQEQFNKAEINQRIAKLHVPFIINQGQTDERVKFYANTFGGTVFVTNEGQIVYSIPKFEEKKAPKEDLNLKPETRNSKLIKGLALKEEIVGGKVNDVKGEGKAITKVSYFRGNDPSKWKGNIPTYDLVSLGEVYKGVELKLKAHGKNVEKLFYVKPGGKTGSISIKLSGAKGLNVNEKGELEIETELGMVKLTKPVAYQKNGGKRESVEVAYVVKRDEYGFKLGEYDRTKELVIDPILAATFLGGTGFDEIFAITLDGAGNVFVAGDTESSDFPGVGAGSADSTFAGSTEAFIAKLNSNLSTIIAATFLGGSGGEDAEAITLDGAGNVFVAGETDSSDFPGVGPGSAQGTFGGGIGDAYVAKLNSNLSTIIAATFLGGSSFEFADAITLDSAGNVFVAGGTGSSDFPGVGPGSAQSTSKGSPDGFVAKLNSGLSSILAATFLGGSSADRANAITLDSAGNVFVAGFTGSSDFPGVGPGSAQGTFGGGTEDGFVAKLNSGLSSILAATFLGGTGDDSADAITLDSAGNVFVAGTTESSDFPGVGAGSDDSTFAGGREAFVAKLNSGLSSIIAATFLGGSSKDDFAFAITLDDAGNVFVAGLTGSPDFPGVGPGSAQSTFGGGTDHGFVAKLDPNLSAKTSGGGSGNGCSIGGPVQIGTGMTNLLIPLLPAFAIGLRALRRRARKNEK
jgi:beta-propeller repeat-containing protein